MADTICTMCIQNESLYVGTWNGALLHYDLRDSTTTQISQQLNAISTITMDSPFSTQKRIFTGTEFGAITCHDIKYNKKEELNIKFGKKDKFLRKNISCVALDE